MRVVMAHHDLDDALEGFRKKDKKTWTLDEVRKDRKPLPMIHL
jgi:ribosomal protein S21